MFECIERKKKKKKKEEGRVIIDISAGDENFSRNQIKQHTAYRRKRANSVQMNSQRDVSFFFLNLDKNILWR